MESLEMVKDETGGCHCPEERFLVLHKRDFGRLWIEKPAKSWNSYCRVFEGNTRLEGV